MAEIIGLIASIVSLVATGAKLCQSLYGIGASIGSAETELTSIAEEIDLFCSVLNHLRSILQKQQARARYSKECLETINNIVLGCEGVFNKVNMVIGKLQKQDNNDAEASVVAGITWHYQKPKVQILKGKLESLKTTLQIMLATAELETHTSRTFVS